MKQVQKDSFFFLDKAGLEPKEGKEFWQGGFYDTGLPLVGHHSPKKRGSRFLFSLGAVTCAFMAVLYLLLTCYRHLSLEVNRGAESRRLATGGPPPPPTCAGASHGPSEEEKEGGAEGGDSQVGQQWPQQARGAPGEPHDSVQAAGQLSSAAAPEAVPSAGVTSPTAPAPDPQDSREMTWKAWGMHETLTVKLGKVYEKFMLINQICSEGINLLHPEDACDLVESVAGLQAITLSAFSLAPTEHEPQRRAVVQNTLELVESTIAAVARRMPDAHSQPSVQRLAALQRLLAELRNPSPFPKNVSPPKFQKKFATLFSVTDLVISKTTGAVNSLFAGRFIPGWKPAEEMVRRSLAGLSNVLATRVKQFLMDKMMGWWIFQCQKKTDSWVLFTAGEYFTLRQTQFMPPITEQRAQLEKAFADGEREALLSFSSAASAGPAVGASPGFWATTEGAQEGLKVTGQAPDITMRMSITVHGPLPTAPFRSPGFGADDRALPADTSSSVSTAGAAAAASSASGELHSDQASAGTQKESLSSDSASKGDEQTVLQATGGATGQSTSSAQRYHQALSSSSGTDSQGDEDIDFQLKRLLSFGPTWADITDEDGD